MRRHPELERWVLQLEPVIAGQCREWSMPPFAWVESSRCSFGRKGLGRDGEPLLMPARLDFGSRRFLERPEGVLPAVMTAPGLRVEVDYDPTTGLLTEPDSAAEPQLIGRPRLPDGEAAAQGRWWILSQAERMLIPALHRAHTHLSVTLARQLGQPQRRWVSHEEITGQIADEIWLSDAVQQGLPRALTTPVMKADPIRVAAMLVRREAHKGLHRHLDDPKQGSVIRTIASELGTRDVDVIVREYRRRQHGQTRVGARAAARALTIEPTVQARSQGASEG